MFALVKSTREDRRQIGSLESLTERLAGQVHGLRSVFGKSTDSKLAKRLSEAGLRNANAVDLFLLVRVLFISCGAVLGKYLLSTSTLWMFAGGGVGFIASDFWLARRQHRRRARLSRAIPDMVDLLVICVGAGLGIDQALLRVTEELGLSHYDLSLELGRVLLERSAGASRGDAWHSLAERLNLEEMNAFVSMIAETERFGSPILTALSDFSDELRTKRRQRAEEAAAQSKAKIIFPLVLCIFPCIFIVLLAPALMTFFSSFGSVSR